MIQLSRTETRLNLSSESVQEIQNQFRTSHYAILPNLLDPELLDITLARLGKAQFVTRQYEDFGRDEWPDDPVVPAILNLVCNGDVLLKTVEELTGAGPLDSFVGKIYRMVPGKNHFDSWHDDLIDGRRVALSINLSPEPFGGGVLEIRKRDTKEVVSRVAGTESGHGILFRIDDNLEHRRTPVIGETAKVAFAGWFKSGMTFHEHFRINRRY